MKKVLKTLVIAVLATPVLTFANTAPTATQAQVVNGKVTVVSPRTGIQYSIDNPNERPVLIQTEAIAPATSATVDRIVASNPALSEESQQEAKKALLATK
jgi:hypothetical protein